jgi:choline dehydrogenase-like flavoprotein
VTDAADVVIVGSGAGGAASAWALTTAGLRVLVLEAGPRFEPAVDYPLTDPDWERRAFPSPPGSTAEILYGDLGRLDPADADLQSFDAVTPRRAPGEVRVPGGVGYSHVRGVGGSTLHYVGEAHRLHPGSFKLARDHGVGADWPLSYDDLAPFYDRAERAIGVAGPAQQSGRPRASAFPQTAHPLSPAARRLAEAGERIGLPFEANSRAVLSRPTGGRPACNYCGQCSRGCPIGDKGSSDVTFLRQAEATGRLTVRAGAEVTRLEIGQGGRVVALRYVHDGIEQRLETPTLILAAGAVQTPRLLLASASPEVPDGVANGSGQVGRNFMETLRWQGTALLPGLTDSHKGLPADAVSWAENAPDAVPGAVGGCRYTSAVQETGLTGPIGYATRLVPGHGAAFHARLRQAFGSAITVGATGAVVPDARSRVTVHPERRDGLGVPLPVIASVLTDNSLALMHHMAAKGRALLQAAGAGAPLEQITSWDRFTSTHVFGTARMGDDSATSVTDAQGRCHDHDNLWIADGSLFPSSGGGEGPSLTIHALAIRAAERLVAGR